jgi:hypothetical protein
MRHEMGTSPLDPKQRKRAIASALALAAMAVGIYLVVIMKFFVYK